eukprot:7391660-Prymnesium_polylepis.2
MECQAAACSIHFRAVELLHAVSLFLTTHQPGKLQCIEPAVDSELFEPSVGVDPSSLEVPIQHRCITGEAIVRHEDHRQRKPGLLPVLLE